MNQNDTNNEANYSASEQAKLNALSPEEIEKQADYKRLYLLERGKNLARKIIGAVGLLIYKIIVTIWMAYELYHHTGKSVGTIVWDSLVLIFVVVASIFDLFFIDYEVKKYHKFCRDYHFDKNELLMDSWNLKRRTYLPQPLKAAERKTIDENREHDKLVNKILEAKGNRLTEGKTIIEKMFQPWENWRRKRGKSTLW